MGSGLRWFQQDDPASIWQAPTSVGPATVDSIEWGDELLLTWEVGSVIPIETDFWSTSDLFGYDTVPLFWQDGQQVWGISGTLTAYGEVSVYTPAMTITIRQIADANGIPVDVVVYGPRPYEPMVNVKGEPSTDSSGIPLVCRRAATR